MFHVSDYGPFGERVKDLADADGYVPELGDKEKDFNYLHNIDDWNNHVFNCVKTVEKIEEDIELWRENGG